ncbi:pantoate--beta-alanine ligase [Methyloradius palustris]|uniref:Pantothenate synthetase n=1 Tax=Methyloradius palustris TaxID=2778876 RepID=A0A8D5JVR3_9PROT|nr:pantoate--beta-alanine ligase [Methyloradius palustris]BCM24374.1 pantothenate synthetase [Methyloradius palustris]
MQIIYTIAELRLRLASQKNIGLVTTMGNLHAGHIHLVNLAKQQSDCIVVSIFVNPLQFGVNEDLAAYPRTLDADCKKLEAAGVDIVFAPSESEVYPTPQTMTILPPAIAEELCGASRPGHFAGVATVVSKLFNIVRPDVAVFGKKDFQQLFIIRQLVSQFNLPIEIVAGETIREEDGLAMSSRNGYLNPAERLEAQRLSRALKLVVDAVKKKKLGFTEIESQTTQYLTQLGWIVDYISIRNQDTLLPASTDNQKLVALGAARLGRTRLIDNIEFDLG